MFMGKAKAAALLLLALLLQPTLVSSRHFNCANVCEEAGRGHPDRPSGTEVRVIVLNSSPVTYACPDEHRGGAWRVQVLWHRLRRPHCRLQSPSCSQVFPPFKIYYRSACTDGNFIRPWVGVQAPVIGSRLDDVKKCAESGAFSVLDVITDLDVLEV